jgi:hypothetical protein
MKDYETEIRGQGPVRAVELLKKKKNIYIYIYPFPLTFPWHSAYLVKVTENFALYITTLLIYGMTFSSNTARNFFLIKNTLLLFCESPSTL